MAFKRVVTRGRNRILAALACLSRAAPFAGFSYFYRARCAFWPPGCARIIGLIRNQKTNRVAPIRGFVGEVLEMPVPARSGIFALSEPLSRWMSFAFSADRVGFSVVIRCCHRLLERAFYWGLILAVITGNAGAWSREFCACICGYGNATVLVCNYLRRV